MEVINMNYEIVNLEEKIIVGVSAITSNEDPKMEKVIGGLWEKLYQDGINKIIKNKVNEYAIGLYSDYENNKISINTADTVAYYVGL